MRWNVQITRRLYIALVACLGFACMYALRVNLSVAILEMTKAPHDRKLDNGTIVQESGEFYHWSNAARQWTLSAFFFGYIVTQIPAGYLAGRFGGRTVMGFGGLVAGAVALWTPLLVPQGVGFLIGLRVLQGLCQGVVYPSIHAVWSRWAPPIERTRLVTIGFSGSYLGTVLALPISGYLTETYGWRSTFIFFGVCAVAWSVLWLSTVSDDPTLDKWIKIEEIKEIQEGIGYSHEQAAHLTPPWKSILTSIPVWAIIIAHFSENWGFYTMLTELPRFIQALEPNFMPLKASMVAAVPYLVMAIMIQVGGRLADYLIEKRKIKVVRVRKLFNCGAFIGQALFTILCSYATNPAGVLVCVCLSVGFGGFAWSGFSVNHLDIAPQFASVLMGVSNTGASIPGMISPLVTGALVKVNDKSIHDWEGVWWLAASIFIVGAIMYGLMASGEKQPWAQLPEGYEPHRDEVSTVHSGFATLADEMD